MESKEDIRRKLTEELTAANGSPEHSADMVRRIEAGKLQLARTHSDEAHRLAALLVAGS